MFPVDPVKPLSPAIETFQVPLEALTDPILSTVTPTVIPDSELIYPSIQQFAVVGCSILTLAFRTNGWLEEDRVRLVIVLIDGENAVFDRVYPA